jgi:hypothetical protein
MEKIVIAVGIVGFILIWCLMAFGAGIVHSSTILH